MCRYYHLSDAIAFIIKETISKIKKKKKNFQPASNTRDLFNYQKPLMNLMIGARSMMVIDKWFTGRKNSTRCSLF